MKTVLIVDDEPFCIKLYTESLQARFDDRIKMITFTDPLAARLFVGQSGPVVDLAILDLHMPRLSGLELGYDLIAINANVPLIFVTGGGSDDVDDFNRGLQVRLKASAMLFLKPMSMEVLMEYVEASLFPVK